MGSEGVRAGCPAHASTRLEAKGLGGFQFLFVSFFHVTSNRTCDKNAPHLFGEHVSGLGRHGRGLERVASWSECWGSNGCFTILSFISILQEPTFHKILRPMRKNISLVLIMTDGSCTRKAELSLTDDHTCRSFGICGIALHICEIRSQRVVHNEIMNLM